MDVKPHPASPEQRRASDPCQNAWVAAHAGSGKTHVLVDRVIRLMLAGTAPDRILCITFTKAAAAEMATRLASRLATWVAFDDANLTAHMEAMGLEKPDAKDLARGRTLFTLALETPGGLKIQTIHAFCERLLQLFPLEAGIAPGFSVMDERMAAGLLEQARHHVIREAENDAESPLGAALRRVVLRVHTDDFDKLIRAVMQKSGELARSITPLTERLSLDEPDRLMDIDRAMYERIADLFSVSTSRTETKNADLIRRILKGDEIAPQELFLKGDLKPKSLTSLITARTGGANPWTEAFLQIEQLRVRDELGRRAEREMRDRTEDLISLAAAIIREYERLKRVSGQYDFHDLISRTKRLLTKQATSAWVLFKLDGGIEHLLVDEAQDTSPEQWDVIRALTEEFAAGEGTRPDVGRTVFVVGDRKQSIFSFQGADPDAFEASHSHFRKRIRAAGLTFDDVPLTVSYRSTGDVLTVVDKVFEGEAARAGLDSAPLVHEPTRKGEPGLVELWPAETKDDKDEPDHWQAPLDHVAANHPSVKLARRIAGKIRDWIAGGRMLAALNRPVRPGDILILVRQRDTLFRAIIAELRRLHVPVAGADRITLNDHLAVQDLLALGRFVTMPDDDYALACLLKSPLVVHPDGRVFNDDDLFTLAHDRGAQSLWQRLGADERLRPIREKLESWIALNENLTPFDFYHRILNDGAPTIRQRMLARLGAEAGEATEAFLSLAEDYERANPPSLSGFLVWFAEAETEIKRDMEQGGDAVRIMTVHGAKGLEANIVVLTDNCKAPDARQEPKPLMVPSPEGGFMPFWRWGKTVESSAMAALRREVLERIRDEYRRLLYVGLTRARDELYVCGFCIHNAPDSDSWFGLVQSGLARDPAAVTDGEGIVRRGISGIAAGGVSSATASMPLLPAWLRNPASSVHSPQPARASAKSWMRAPEGSGLALAMARGRAMHALFQHLPDLDATRRPVMTRRILARLGMPEDQWEAVLAEVIAVIDHPDHAAYFGRESLAEIPVLAGALSGRIDRIVITESRILLLDFKTDRDLPESVEAVPAAYLNQLAAYGRALEAVFAGRSIEAALLWTAAPRLMPIPPELLAAHMTAM